MPNDRPAARTAARTPQRRRCRGAALRASTLGRGGHGRRYPRPRPPPRRAAVTSANQRTPPATGRVQRQRCAVNPSTHRSDRRTYPGGVTEVILAVVTIAGGYLTTRTWPSLLSRIKEHAALWKDVPDELRDDLRELLRDKLELLAKRDRKRLNAEN